MWEEAALQLFGLAVAAGLLAMLCRREDRGA